MVMIGVPNEGAFFWQLAYKLQPRSRETTDHVQFYTIKNLSPKCKQAGFNIQEAKPIGWGRYIGGSILKYAGIKWVDDFFEFIGKNLLPLQATSLYIILRKK